MFPLATLFELTFRALALLVTAEAARTLTEGYLDALKEATRTYLLLVDGFYTQQEGQRRTA